jgi:thioredoxin-like negative regulator of GroEL
MSLNKQIITHMTPADVQFLQNNAKDTLIVIKFGAKWCKPCTLIKPTCEEWFYKCHPSIIYVDIDIDESLDLYMAFKNKKMIKGVPTIFAFNTETSRDQWYIPDDSVIGGDINAVKAFFERCNEIVKKMN